MIHIIFILFLYYFYIIITIRIVQYEFGIMSKLDDLTVCKVIHKLYNLDDTGLYDFDDYDELRVFTYYFSNCDPRISVLRIGFEEQGMNRSKRRAIRAYRRELRRMNRVDETEEKRISHMRDIMRKRRKDFNKLKLQKSSRPLPTQNCVD